ncbi:MAG: hypothetical protein GC157_14255 [Frankiales bacterium]|nr:hypothetical protein [Frankiales bacterium]
MSDWDDAHDPAAHAAGPDGPAPDPAPDPAAGAPSAAPTGPPLMAPSPTTPPGPLAAAAAGAPAVPPPSPPAAPPGSDTVVPAGAADSPEAVFAAAEGSRAERRRAAEEAARQSSITSQRRALMVSGLVLGILVVIIATWFLVFGRGSAEPDASESPPATPTGPSQPTLLVQLKGEDGIAVSNALLSVGGRTGRANDISIPPNVVLDVATGGALPFGEIVRLTQPDASASALSDAIGVDVNATFTMDPLAFSGLVDAVGGVIVDVDTDVVQTEPDGTKVVVIPAGKAQTLEGPQAARYASYLGPGEPEEARMARFTQVLRLVISKLPSDPSKVEPILTGLGASSKSTAPVADLAAFLVRMHADVLSDNVAYQNLPVTPLDTGGVAASRVDQEAAAAMVNQLLPDAMRTPGPNSKVRVLVQNGDGRPGLNAAARQRIVDAGYTYVNGGNASSFGQPTTAIVVPDASAESLRWGNEIAAALKVPATAVQVATTSQTVADVIVVLGADFTPS